MEDTLQEGNQSQSTLLGKQALKSPRERRLSDPV